MDDYCAIMQLTEYVNKSEYGWSIDHILPESKGGTDHKLNLQALHWQNNDLKADNFFGVEVAVGTTYGNPYENVKGAPLKPHLDLRALEELKSIYPDNWYVQEAIDTILFGPVEFVKIT